MLTSEQYEEIQATTCPCEWETDFDLCSSSCAVCPKRYICALLSDRAELEAEIERLKETNTRLNRRATKAEAIADKSIEQLRNEGQRNLGRMLANYAAEKYHRECAEKDAEIERLRAINQYLFEAVEIAGCLPEMLAGLNEALDVLEGKA